MVMESSHVKVFLGSSLPLPNVQELAKKAHDPGIVESSPRREEACVFSEQQKLNWRDLFYMVTLPTHQRLHSLFEKLRPAYRENVEEYALELQRLDMKVMNFMSRAPEMDAEELRTMFEDEYQGVRTNYYPPCPQPQLVVGLTPHSDSRTAGGRRNTYHMI